MSQEVARPESGRKRRRSQCPIRPASEHHSHLIKGRPCRAVRPQTTPPRSARRPASRPGRDAALPSAGPPARAPAPPPPAPPAPPLAARVPRERRGPPTRARRIPGRRGHAEDTRRAGGALGPRWPLSCDGPGRVGPDSRGSRAARQHPPAAAASRSGRSCRPSASPSLQGLLLRRSPPDSAPAACASAPARVPGPRIAATPSQLRSAAQPNCGPRPRGVRTNRWAVPQRRQVSIGQGGGGRFPQTGALRAASCRVSSPGGAPADSLPALSSSSRCPPSSQSRCPK
ncbi:collagen alpha-1(I) chain-like [Phodopus roborovskii]|uniref:collagen alpha-1(I) chain-like n=1 Tax=Phodopus roborovskii TaxID=109678 RepID=UPI0021E49F0C|nr:collagen alpha-1(I) chain-like [Phodopus roborovskii]